MERNLADVFEIVVDAVPDREALVVADRRLTFAALDERANRLAQHLASAPPVRPPIRRTGDALYLLYTGGTTGMPKGVMWRHADILAAGLGDLDGATTAEEEAERARAGRDRHLAACPLMHGAAQWVTLAT